MMDPDRENPDLVRLFELTRELASDPTLTRLAARAADIPERAGRQLFRRWAWLPAFIGAALAAGAVLAGLFARAPEGPGRSWLSHSALPLPSSSGASASLLERPGVAAGRDLPEEETADGVDLSADAEEGEHFELARPRSDRELDAWLAATKDVSGGS